MIPNKFNLFIYAAFVDGRLFAANKSILSSKEIYIVHEEAVRYVDNILENEEDSNDA